MHAARVSRVNTLSCPSCLPLTNVLYTFSAAHLYSQEVFWSLNFPWLWCADWNWAWTRSQHYDTMRTPRRRCLSFYAPGMWTRPQLKKVFTSLLIFYSLCPDSTYHFCKRNGLQNKARTWSSTTSTHRFCEYENLNYKSRVSNFIGSVPENLGLQVNVSWRHGDFT